MPLAITSIPKPLKPYAFHGLELDYRPGNDQARGDCPFCGKEGKLFVNSVNGLWDCKVCGLSGNLFVFLRKLWEASDENTTDYDDLKLDRGYLNPDTLMRWGVCQSILTGEWMIPGYNREGKLTQLYRYVELEGKRRLLATPELGHGIHGADLYDPKKGEVWICEGPWDGIALWEVMRSFKRTDDGGYAVTGNEESSLLHDANVIAVPGANVFIDSWLHLLGGKRVILTYDSDHPRKHPTTGKELPPVGMEGVKRVVRMLATAESPPTEVCWVQWGRDGYDSALPSGHDIRDSLTAGERTPQQRLVNYAGLVEKVVPVPQEWLAGVTRIHAGNGKPGQVEIECTPCSNWNNLVNGWRKAMKWTEGLDRALSVMLSVITTTETPGDQLWCKVMGPASCGKTSLCEAVSVAKKYVMAKSTIRGFHSGYGPRDEDNSLIKQLYNKTLVTKDGDSLLTAPNLSQILAEARDIYDRTSRAHYRTGKDKDYEGVNMTWILCGTGSLRSLDQSELGERFLDCVIMDGIDEAEEDDILDRVGNRVVSNMRRATAPTATDGAFVVPGISQEDYAMLRAKQLTGGYVEHLRKGADQMLGDTRVGDDAVDICKRFAKFVAYMRARPSERQSERAEREFATRLLSQHIRLGMTLAVVVGDMAMTDEVIRRTRRVAVDTSRGVTLEIARALHAVGKEGLDYKTVAFLTNQTQAEAHELLRFMRQIKAVETFATQPAVGMRSTPKWRLTERVRQLYTEVVI